MRLIRNLALLLAGMLVLAGCKGSAPLIGISCGWDGGRIDVSDAYAISVRAAGGVPVVLPPVLSMEEAASVLGKVDALILTGGEDVDPARYGEAVLNATVEVNGARDTSDFYLATEALRMGLPILGICRGGQLMNVVLGGSLYQDLPTCIGSEADGGSSAVHGSFLSEPVRGGSGVNGTTAAIAHRQSEPDGVGTHMIYIEAGSRLHEILGADSLMVNSFHHQAVKDPGAGVHVVARAADSVVEAWEYDSALLGGDVSRCSNAPRRASILCVQFHPELLYARGGNSTFLPIFEDLVARAW